MSNVTLCLKNWLGYGNLNGSVWFMGTEEGGAEIWREKIATKTLDSSLLLRSKFSIAMDFVHVWEELYKIPLNNFKDPCVWRYMAAFLLAFQNKPNGKDQIATYLFTDKKLGRTQSDHFLCELLPLPKKKKDKFDADYKLLPEPCIWKDVRTYHQKVIPCRIELIKNQLQVNMNVKLLISYEQMFTQKILKAFNHKELQPFKDYKQCSLYELHLGKGRKLFLLSTPFFGQGRISYDGIRRVVNELSSNTQLSGLYSQ